MRILLTGGTGFIGSHTAVELLQEGHDVVLYDNLCNSSPLAADAIAQIAGKRAPLMVGDIRDKALMSRVLKENHIEAVIHFAGLKAVGESCVKPLDYYDNNIAGTVTMLEAMREAGVKKLVFSSSSTVYGTPQKLPLTETHPVGNGITNPYGRTKVMIEEILSDLCHSDSDWSVICLRYFNPIGAHPSGLIGENPSGTPNNLLPYVARVASGRLKAIQVFGNDYPTPDGTGVRDYIHVVDLARGHACAIHRLNEMQGWDAINLGTGQGYSVLDIIHAFEKACGQSLPYQIMPRRAGDIAANWADPAKAEKLLGWKAQYGIEAMCKDAWRFEETLAKKLHS